MVAAARDIENRKAERVNTLLAADALIGNTCWPVRIRNISSTGVMVETAVKVDVKSSILIKRGTLHVAGEIVWRRDGVFGVRFFEPADVAPWLGISSREAVASIDQCAQSGIQASASLSEAALTRRIAEEIAYAERLVSAVASSLSEDPILRVRYCGRVQELSIAADMLNQLSMVLISDNKMNMIEACVTGPMKHRILR